MTQFRQKDYSEYEKEELAKIFKEYEEQYPDVLDCSSMKLEEIKAEMKAFVDAVRNDKSRYLAKAPKDNPLPKSYLYGGICNDIPSNLSRHKIDGYLRCIFVKDATMAKDVEKALCGMGLYIGKGGISSAGNGAKDEGTPTDTRIVYIADMTIPGFSPAESE